MISQTSNEIASQGSWRVVVVVVTVVDLEPSRLAESTPVARKKKEKKPKREKEREGETIQGRGRHRWKLSCRSTRDQLPSPLFIPAAPLEKVETNYFFFCNRISTLKIKRIKFPTIPPIFQFPIPQKSFLFREVGLFFTGIFLKILFTNFPIRFQFE